MSKSFSIGDHVVNEKHGEGVVIGKDPTSKEFRYNISFKDGTRIWLDGSKTKLSKFGAELKGDDTTGNV